MEFGYEKRGVVITCFYASMVEIFIVVSSNTSNSTFTVSNAVSTVTLFSQAQALIVIPSASCVPAGDLRVVGVFLGAAHTFEVKKEKQKISIMK